MDHMKGFSARAAARPGVMGSARTIPPCSAAAARSDRGPCTLRICGVKPLHRNLEMHGESQEQVSI